MTDAFNYFQAFGIDPSLVPPTLRGKMDDWAFAKKRERYEGSLRDFVRDVWSWIDSSEYLSCWAIDAVCEHLEAVTEGEILRLLINQPPRTAKTTITSICWPAWTWARSDISFLSGPQVRFLCASYNERLSFMNANKSRRLLLSPFFKQYWGERFSLTQDQNNKSQFDNTKGGSRLSTSVGGSLLGLGGDIINVDDPHNTETERVIETDADRNKVESWSKELFSTRLNDPKRSAIVVNMQRLHEEDLSGLILRAREAYGEEWIHLCIPMEMDTGRSYVTVTLPGTDEPWNDPRSSEGELMWPERFGPDEVKRLKDNLGPYMCTPAESPVLMADLSIKPIAEIKAGDDVIGFTTDTGREGTNFKGAYKRRHLRASKVKAVTMIKAPVVKITLDSGETIRCTPDHRWYMGKRGGRRGEDDMRPLYRSAKLGTELMRVCPAALPELTDDDLRMAGWLSGFFDGEGTVSLCAKNGPQFRKSSTIKFHQGAGRNKPLCDLLEKTLQHFGFEFSYRETIRSDRKVSKSEHKNRVYTLYGASGVPLFQRFLHIAHKWRDRVIHGAMGTKWIVGKERVVSIEPDGIEQVYALETETGNYVVWGLASANSSGRLQQLPVPKGGGILQREWWKLWDNEMAQRYGVEWHGARKEFPAMDLIVASLDTSYGEKEENDYNALTIWGIFQDKGKNRRAMLMYGWQKRLKLHGIQVDALPGESKIEYDIRRKEEWGLVEWVSDTCKRYRVNRVLIENKTRGKDIADEIKKLNAREQWDVWLLDPSGDKVSRGHSVVPLFTDGSVWAPDTAWSEIILQQCATVPKAAHDDLYDTVTQFLRWARENGLLVRGEEMNAALEDKMQYLPPAQTVAQQYGV